MSIRVNSFVGNSHPVQSALSGYIVDRETLLVLGVNLSLIGERSCRKEEGKELHFSRFHTIITSRLDGCFVAVSSSFWFFGGTSQKMDSSTF